MKTTQLSSQPRLVSRALLLPVGEGARQMAEAVVAISEKWLGGEAPVQIACDQTDGDELAGALERLTSQELMRSLQGRGIGLARANESEVWAIIDLTGDPTGGKTAEVAVAEVAEKLETITEKAWRQLRIHVVAHSLLLARPADYTHLSAWSEGLATHCPQRVYLAGPVNQAHLSLADEKWRTQAATALAGLLWSKAPSHSQLVQEQTGGHSLIALGGAAWNTPRTEVIHWLALRFAQRTVARLSQEDATVRNGPDPHLPTAQQSMQELLAQLTAPPAGLLWGERRPGLAALTELPETLVHEVERAQKQQGAEAQLERRRWLASQLEGGSRLQAEVRRAYLQPPEGWPRLAAYGIEVTARRESLLQRLQDVQKQLEEWGERLAQAEDASRQAQAELTELCALFPTQDLQGAFTALTHPWRLISWLWVYLVWLPQRAQHLLDSLARQTTARWHETNWHTIRQLLLAQAQEWQLVLDEAERLSNLLAQMEDEWAGELAGMALESVQPWTETTLDALCNRLLADGTLCALGFLENTPLYDWLEQDRAALRAALLAWPQPWLAPLERWDGVDFLVEALSGPALADWLGQVSDTALPLWPDEEMRSSSLGENRLLLGRSPLGAEDADASHGERLDRWRDAADVVGNLVETLFHGDGVALLRLALVDLALDDPSGEMERGEHG